MRKSNSVMLVFVDLPEVGRTFAQGEQFGSIESVKAVSDLYCPVTGEIVEVNAALAEKPESVNPGSARRVDDHPQADQPRRAVAPARRRRLRGHSGLVLRSASRDDARPDRPPSNFGILAHAIAIWTRW